MKKDHGIRKIKTIIAGTAVILILSVIFSAAVQKSDDKEAVPQPRAETLASVSSEEKEAGNTAAKGSKADKTETVYVKADAVGNVQEITVEDILKSPGGSDTISDYSSLEDIRNTKGDEEFRMQKDGTILWDNQGEDICYEGKSKEKLPISTSISYYLDDQSITPEELAGKSGRVRIRFDYQNRTAQEVTIEGKKVKVCVPFAVLSALFLPSSHASNIEVSNGKVITQEGQNIVIGYACPGLADSLCLQEYKVTEDISVPDYVEVTFDAEDFELAFTATVASPGLFSDIDTDTLDDADKLTDSMAELTDASSKLTDGCAELLDGTETLKSYMDAYIQGVGQVSEGSASLADGLSALNSKKEALYEGASALQKGLESLHASLDKINLPADSGTDDKTVENASQSLAKDARTLAASLSSLLKSLDEIQTFAADAASYTRTVDTALAAAKESLNAADMSRAEAAATQTAKEQAAGAVNAALADTDLTEEEKAQIRESVVNSIDTSGSTSAVQDHISSAKENLDSIPSLSIPELTIDTSQITGAVSDMQTQLEILSEYSSQMSGAAETLSFLNDALRELKNGVGQLQNGSKQLTEGIAAFNQGIRQLYQGSAALNSGTDQLAQAGSSINTGFDTLVQGTAALKDGMETFDKDGIQNLSKLAGEDLENVITRFKALKEADKQYDNFSGIRENQTGSVKFIIETEEIVK